MDEQPAGTDAERPAGPRRAPAALPDRIDGRIRPAALVRWGFFLTVGVLLAWVVAQALVLAHDLLILVLVAMFLAVSLDPAVRWLTKRGMKRGPAVALIVVVLVGILAAFLISVIPPLVNQFTTLVHNMPAYLGRLEERSRRYQDLNLRYHLSDRLEGIVGQLPERLASGLVGFTSRVVSVIAAALTVLVFTIYFLLDLPRLRRGVVRLFPVDRRPRYGAMVDVVVDKVGTYMIGRLTIGLIGGVVAGIALAVLGIPYALPLAILIGLLDVIPLLGHPAGSIVAVAVALFTVPLWPTTVVLVAVLLGYQQVENYLIGPRVLGQSVEISSAAVLLATLIGAAILGVVGALMAIPIAAAVKVLLVQQIDEHEAAVSGVSAATADTAPRHWWRGARSSHAEGRSQPSQAWPPAVEPTVDAVDGPERGDDAGGETAASAPAPARRARRRR
jgi:predicted PurR-regulated permease PerM